ncbi:MAG: dihydrofolate reductase family protein, partial [Actinomycetota bacterium]
GPRLNQALLATDRVDEVFLTVAPTLVGGPAPRIVAGEHEATVRLMLLSAFEHDGDLLLRYRHPRHGDE